MSRASIKWAASGRPWAVYGDEQGPRVAADLSNLNQLRRDAIWGNLMGVEWYFGYQNTYGDVQSEDWRQAEELWKDTRHALDFFQQHLPFLQMEPGNNLSLAGDGYVLADVGKVYAVYQPGGQAARIMLPDGPFSIRWYDPRNGGRLGEGTVGSTLGGSAAFIGLPSADMGQDWVGLIRRTIEGDLNGDFRTDIVDLTILLNHFNDPVGSMADGDISGPNGVPDGRTDIDDLTVMLNHFNGQAEGHGLENREETLHRATAEPFMARWHGWTGSEGPKRLVRGPRLFERPPTY